MKEIPKDVSAYKKTPVYSNETVPAGLLKAHTTKEGTWGKICVKHGSLLYVIEAEPEERVVLNDSVYGVVEPQIPHHVELNEPVEFFVEFYK
ncbi:MAG: DUF1971 domain-containing protein [Bdellovibrionales bacterium]|nr:DUF1971 domain-containing protein [Bdellovibrionales bacterium]